MKIFLIIIFWIFTGGILLVGLNAGSFTLLLPGGILTAIGVLFATSKAPPATKIVTVLDTDPDFAASDYKHLFQGSAIGVNSTSKMLHLMNGGLKKSYRFEDVRHWRTNIESGGEIFGTGGGIMGGAQIMGANRRNAQHNREKSGLFLTVKDIEHPIWQINFAQDKSMQIELARWMEILTQNIAEK